MSYMFCNTGKSGIFNYIYTPYNISSSVTMTNITSQGYCLLDSEGMFVSYYDAGTFPVGNTTYQILSIGVG